MRTLLSHRSDKGLTLVELAVVGAIMAILAGIAGLAVTGQVSSSRSATRTSDESEVTRAAHAFSGLNPAGAFPIQGTSFDVTEVDMGRDLNADGDDTDVDAVRVWAIDWTAVVNPVDDPGGRRFAPDLITKPNHADETVVIANATRPVWALVDTDGDNILGPADVAMALLQAGAY